MEHNDCPSHEPSSSSSTNYHLEYLDEFLHLICAPELITMGLFPNAKEITESFAVWAALRRFIFPRIEQQLPSISSSDQRQNAIIAVGDGMTPRTAALCAYLTKGSWQCFSIDPMLQYDTYTDMLFVNRRSLTKAEHCADWKLIKGLRIIRAKIQTVSVQCRKAIVVLMHAHVTLEDAIAAVDASDGIIGIVTCPCCKWIPFQQEWLGQSPHHHYTDLRLLSGKNEMNVWIFPEGYDSKSFNTSINLATECKQSQMKPLIERNVWGIDTSIIESKLSCRDGVKQRAIELWPKIFLHGSKVFNNDNNEDIWPWSSTSWSPKDILPLMKLCNNESTLTIDGSIISSWLGKSVIVVGTIAAVRRCKHTTFYELNPCVIPPESLEPILRLTCEPSTMTIDSILENQHATADTFPALLKSADRMWICVEYQRHLQAVLGYDAAIGRKTKDHNSQTATNNTKVLANTDRVNIVLPLLHYQGRTTSDQQNELPTTCEDPTKTKLFEYNPQPRESLFPWAMYLRPGDIIVAYCELVCNASHRPQLRLIDGILLFDSMLHMISADRRLLK